MTSLPEPSILRLLRSIFVVVLLIGIILSVVSYLVSMAIGAWVFFGDPAGIATGAKTIYGLPVFYFLFLLYFEVPFDLPIVAVFAGLMLVFVSAFLGSYLSGTRFDRAVRESFRRPLSVSFRNWLFTMPVVTSMLLLALVALTALQESQGIETGTIDVPDRYQFFFSLSYAAVFEELGFRIIPLGAFLVLRAIIFDRSRLAGLSWAAKSKTLILAFIFPNSFRRNLRLPTVEDVGFRKSMRLGDWIIILLTSLSFGLAHYLGGWEVGKISQTFVAGMVLGPLFMTYGAPANILTHWMFNFYPSSYEFGPEILWLLPDFAVLITGIAGWIGAIGYGLRRVLVRTRKSTLDRSGFGMLANYCGQCGEAFDVQAAFCARCGSPRDRIIPREG